MARLGRLLYIAFLVVLLAVGIQKAIDYTFRVQYPVHPQGIILVTGTSSGIGRHATIELAKLNYTVFCTVRKEEDILIWGQESQRLGLENNIKPIIMEVTNTEHIKAARKEIEAYVQSSGKPFVGLVNNAGISTRIPLEIQQMESIKNLFEINFFGTIETTQHFLPLIRQHKGRIVFISSMSAFATLYGSGVYSASKRAVEALADALRIELAPFEVSVTSVAPGFVKTDIIEKATANWKSSEGDVQADSAYPDIREKLTKAREENFKNAPGPEVTSEVIIHALTSPYPHTRYFVGQTGAYPIQILPVLLGILPDRVADALKFNKL